MSIEKIKKYYMDNRLMCNCIMLAILFFVNCFVANFCFVVAIVIMVLMITENRRDGFSILIFSLSFGGIEADYVGFYCLAVCLVVYLIKNYVILYAIDKKKINWKIFTAYSIFAVYSLINNAGFNVQFFITFSAISLFFALINLFTRYTDILNLKFNVNVLSIGVLVSSAYFITYLISPVIGEINLLEYGDYIRFPAFYTNPVILAMVCEICLSFLTYYLLQDKWEWTDIISYLIFAVIGVVTLSKAFLILFSIMFVILIIYVLKRYKQKAVWWVVGAFVLGCMFVLIKRDFLYAYVSRFFSGWNSNMSDYEQIIDIATTGRYKLWTTVLSYIFTHPKVLIFGRGLGAPLVASLSAHNFYISLLYQMGIVGGIIFIGMFVVLIYEYFRQNPHKISKAIAVPIAIMGALLFAEDLFLYIY